MILLDTSGNYPFSECLKRLSNQITFLDDIVGLSVEDIVELGSLDSSPRLGDCAAEVQVKQGARQVGRRVEVEYPAQV